MKITHVYTAKVLDVTYADLTWIANALEGLEMGLEIELKNSSFNNKVYTTLCVTPTDVITVKYTEMGYAHWRRIIANLVRMRKSEAEATKAVWTHDQNQQTIRREIEAFHNNVQKEAEARARADAEAAKKEATNEQPENASK